jgi:flagellar basal body-associated protein FliL
MKQKDLVLILVMVFIGAVVAFVVSRWVFATPQNRQQTAEKVDVITPDFSEPPPKYFNADSVNPTKQIEIGNTSNPNPFNTKSQ